MTAVPKMTAPNQTDLWENPLKTRGFDFVEYTAPNPKDLEQVFSMLGFEAVARHRSKKVTLYRQGDINFIVNAEPESRAQAFAREHGPSACAMAFRVDDAAAAFKSLVEKGAAPVEGRIGPMELNIPAIEGIGGSLIYLTDRRGPATLYEIDFVFERAAQVEGVGLREIDHLTHNVYRGNMDKWAGFYERLFHFREIRYFDIEGKQTGLKSRAMTAPCGKIRIPINESSDDKSQIEEYLHQYQGEGIQHIALTTDDIYDTVDRLTARGVKFLTPPPDTYYDMVDTRVGSHSEDIEGLKTRAILIDGAPESGILLQIFTQNMIGPIFFEIIQRKGNQGFGEGNFKALFESIERDQMERGVLKTGE